MPLLPIPPSAQNLSAANTAAANANAAAANASTSANTANTAAATANAAAANASASANTANTAAATANAAAANASASANTANTAAATANAAASTAQAAITNRLRNPSFAINQRAVSGTVTLAAGAYGHDGVKAGANGATYTFAVNGLDATLTITAGSIILPIENNLIEGGVYTLSQAGTAQARVWQGTGNAGSGAFAACPQTVSGLAANTQTNVEFSTGTVLRPQFQAGSSATPFARRLFTDEQAFNWRYFYRFSGVVGTVVGLMTAYNGSQVAGPLVRFPIDMRVAPSASINNIAYFSIYNAAQSTAYVCSAVGLLYASKTGISVTSYVTASGIGATAGQSLMMTITNAAAAIDASAEL